MTTTHTANLKETLHRVFGFQNFREGQEEAITTLMQKRRLLCILPTGYGKSLLYQLPAYLLDGMTIVISPLLALMRDQIDHLQKRFNISAAAINSDQSDEENYLARQAALNGRIKILFIAPEQLDHVDRFQFLLNLPIQLVVIDEAHCISTWGHDFRPSYRQILQFLHAVNQKDGNIRILGLTATANQRVEQDISKQLVMNGEQVTVLRQTMNRPNIQLSVMNLHGIAQKLAACEELLGRLEGCGLIYCATRENTEIVADYLKNNKFHVAAYHAGYEPKEKLQLQKEFIGDTYKALVATNALGMGIDKGNLRFIIHFDIPGSITAYYQEVGRCGRDGKPAQGIILYDKADQRIHEYFIFSAVPTPEDFQKVMATIASALVPPGLVTIKTLTGLHPTRVTIILAELIEQGFVVKQSIDGKQVYRTLEKSGLPHLERYHTQKTIKTRELEQMLSYGGQNQNCRMATLRSALGDQGVENCGSCDSCKGSLPLQIAPQKIAAINAWVDRRPLPITASIREKIAEGLSVLDSKIRSPLFVHFMQNRATAAQNLDEELFDLLKTHLESLSKKNKLGALVPIPSKTWQARLHIAKQLADHVNVPLLDVLEWTQSPPKRQGELLNNDQRHQNVHSLMGTNTTARIPHGAIILFDDYIGSGNTIKEAARGLKTLCHPTQTIIPFTIACLKWHLGKPGYS